MKLNRLTGPQQFKLNTLIVDTARGEASKHRLRELENRVTTLESKMKELERMVLDS